MSTHVTRRGFLVEAGCLCGGVLAATSLDRAVFAADDRPAWLATCRDAIMRPLGQNDCWSALRAVEAEGLEVDVAPDLTLPSLFHPTTKYTVANAAGVRAACRRRQGGRPADYGVLHAQSI